jgi:polysaccharide pyruvyl transferase WcaK-like protein
MENIQQRINMALSAINYLTNTLDQVNIQALRVKQHQEFADKIAELANEIGDYFHDMDALGEEDLTFINPIFSFINQDNDLDG